MYHVRRFAENNVCVMGLKGIGKVQYLCIDFYLHFFCNSELHSGHLTLNRDVGILAHNSGIGMGKYYPLGYALTPRHRVR